MKRLKYSWYLFLFLFGFNADILSQLLEFHHAGTNWYESAQGFYKADNGNYYQLANVGVGTSQML